MPTIESDISLARTLPADMYRSAMLLAAIREQVFAKSWQLLPAVELEVGQAHPFELLPGCLDEPLVLTRDEVGTHCLSNVCTHRGNLVVTEPCSVKSMRCGYHGRRFRLDGSFVSMPHFQGACDFPTSQDDLPSLRVESLGPLRFTSIDPDCTFEALVGAVEKYVTLDALPAMPTTTRSYDVGANWALYCDNFLEGFHIPFVHPALNAALSGYETELFEQSSLQIGKDDSGIAAHYFWLFPNTMLNFYPWGLSVNVVVPLAVDRSRIDYFTYVSNPKLVDVGAGADLEQVEMEDEAIVESVQRGIRSRLYDRGRYSPKEERAVHHFHRLLVHRLKDGGANLT